MGYTDVVQVFKDNNCTLLITEEEYDKIPKTNSKYKYTASCGHNHEVFYNVFKSRGTGIICPSCMTKKNSIKQKEISKINTTIYSDLEYRNIEYFMDIVKDIFECKFVCEGCLADVAIKPKDIEDDLYIMIQIKSTMKPGRDYGFQCNSRYKNCIIMCICESDKKMWAIDGNTVDVKNKIAIGLKKSKYDDFEVTTKSICERLDKFYKSLDKYDFDRINTPISDAQKVEQEYRKYREKMIKCITFTNHNMQGKRYDFMVNGYKVQEKVATESSKGNIITMNKHSGGKKSISYQKGDNDFYWINTQDKITFYVIPEQILIDQKYINLPRTRTLTINKYAIEWLGEYKFDYTKVDEEKLIKLFKCV